MSLLEKISEHDHPIAVGYMGELEAMGVVISETGATECDAVVPASFTECERAVQLLGRLVELAGMEPEYRVDG